MSLEEFLYSRFRNQWIEEPGIAVYVRKSLRNDIDIELASMEAYDKGKGSLTKLLDRIEPYYNIMVENVLNPRLIDFLKRRGYVKYGKYEGAPSFARFKV